MDLGVLQGIQEVGPMRCTTYDRWGILFRALGRSSARASCAMRDAVAREWGRAARAQARSSKESAT